MGLIKLISLHPLNVFSFGNSGELMGLRVGHDLWRKVGVVFDGFAISPNSLLEWVQGFISDLKGPNETKTQLNILAKDGNGEFVMSFRNILEPTIN